MKDISYISYFWTYSFFIILKDKDWNFVIIFILSSQNSIKISSRICTFSYMKCILYWNCFQYPYIVTAVNKIPINISKCLVRIVNRTIFIFYIKCELKLCIACTPWSVLLQQVNLGHTAHFGINVEKALSIAPWMVSISYIWIFVFLTIFFAFH